MSTLKEMTLHDRIDEHARNIEHQVIAWRRDFHENPELSNREHRTADIVAKHLQRLGFEVQTGVAFTGVVGLLRGGRPGKVVALRADMDALPVAEEVDVPFASKVRSVYEGHEVGVMHACGHDAHVAILMGVAEVLASLKDELKGSVKFIFQPAEEGPPTGEEGGARLMIKEGVLENPKPDAIFGLHVIAGIESGKIGYRSGPALASSDGIEIVIDGKQTHGAFPWLGIDPIVVASQVVLGLQTIASRQMDSTKEPLVITIGSIHGGVRANIIPDSVEMIGTMRTFDQGMREEARERIKNTAEMIASSSGAKACVHIEPDYDVTINDPKLTEAMLPTLERVASKENVSIAQKVMGTEDFSFYQNVIPGFFYLIGITPKGETSPASNHSPHFYIDETGLLLGVRTLANLAVDFLEQ